MKDSIVAAVKHRTGAKAIPSIFAGYADTAYEVDKLGYVVDLKEYLTEKEQDKYIKSYIEEGEFSGDGSLKILPTAKSTEVFMLNKTDWNKFAKATGADINDLKTIEGVTQTAQSYYEWTDSQTKKKNDGKAFFGRDAVANYFLIGAKQLGTEIFSVKNGKVTLNFDKEVIRKIWDNYYVPFVKGYFAASGKFRSDDINTGNILSFVGSSAGATFFPDEVIVDDTKSYPIDMEVLEAPKFEGGENYAVQQGAGMAVTKTDDKQMYASVQFLKWFTEDEKNIQFSVASGYLPVTKTANDVKKIEKTTDLTGNNELSIVKVAIDTVNHNTLYTTKAFENGTDARNILEYAMSDKASADRKTVVKRLEKGESFDEAVKDFVSDSNFDTWYEETKAELEKLVK
ncbi:Bacterial extracellular solute-binding protein [Anaerobutyricum hallii]|uniref:Bacterial extracellular solute-binding protein n=1 Tax=Anaerobutyricum hallii TaxID=39488 RepID=A0A285PMJ2_9FIRM|nr:extracellular solute-binding protein [Anaerobutyricum hallii]SOB70809.1 Bacterial extracellular solute-binding protein [Anaerobutyricum hallii]